MHQWGLVLKMFHYPLLNINDETAKTEALCHSTMLKGNIHVCADQRQTFCSPSPTVGIYLKREKKVKFFYSSHDLITQMRMIIIRF